MKKTLALFLILISLSCRKTDYMEKIEEIMSSSVTFEEAINRLTELDLTTPNDQAKLYLAELYAEKGDSDKSYVYLKKISSEEVFNEVQKVRYYLLKLKYHYSLQEFEEAKNWIEKIRGAESDNETVELDFLEAEIAYLTEDENGLNLYTLLWETEKEAFTEYHFKNFLTLIRNVDKTSVLGLEVMAWIQNNRGYTVGLGTLEADIYENLQDYSLSLLSIYKELEYGYYYNRIDKDQILKNFQRLKTDFEGKMGDEERKAFIDTITALTLYTEEKYSEATPLLKKLLNEKPDNTFLFYLHTTSLIYGGDIYSIDLESFLKKEQQFISHPGYYSAMLRVLQSDTEGYNFPAARKFLEKIIMLNPAHTSAKEARKEIISLLELNCAPTEFFLPDEILFYVKSSLKEYNNEYIFPLNKMLNHPSNYYSDRVVLMLESFTKEFPPFKDKLKNDKKLFSAEAQERLMRAGLI